MAELTEQDVAQPTGRRLGAGLAWAAYLACSWTWCIGMFLPVLLVRDYGVAAWFVFAVPNVIGAAAMGWVLARPGSSQRVVAEHRLACVGFSFVTLAFHAFFLSWLTEWGFLPLAWAVAAVGVGTVVGLVGRRSAVLDLALAGLTLAVSLAVLGRGLMTPHITALWGKGAEAPSAALPPLAVACVFGFLLCPYLDLTFHRAVAATAPRRLSRLAFGVGFGLLFVAMIVLTLLYAGDFADNATVGDHHGSFGLAGLLTWVALHMCVQIGFTWASHLRALPRVRRGEGGAWAIMLIGAAVLAGLGAFFAAQQEWFDYFGAHLHTGEVVYRLFMGFYGLLFPAYVWLMMVPLRGRSPGATVRAVAVWMIACAAAAIPFWKGFVAGRMGWVLPGVAVVLAARAVVGGRAKQVQQGVPVGVAA